MGWVSKVDGSLGETLGCIVTLWKLAAMSIWKEVVSVSGAGSGVRTRDMRARGPGRSMLFRGRSRGIGGVRPCERHVGGHGLAPGAIPIGDDTGNDLPHKLYMSSHIGFHTCLPTCRTLEVGARPERAPGPIGD